MYINDTTQEQKSYQALQADNRGVSLAAYSTNVILLEWYYITPSPVPAFDVYTQKAIEISPVKVGDVYNQTWSVVSLTQQEIDDNIQQAKDDKYTESFLYAETLIDAANETPYIGFTTSAKKNKHRVLTRINRATTDLPKSKKTSLDKDRDDVLADYTDLVMDSDDLVRDAVEAMSDAQLIYAVDVSTVVTWPVWASPV